MDLLYTGFRNIFRNKRRSVINIIAMSIGIILMLLFLNISEKRLIILYMTQRKMDTGPYQILFI